MRSHNELSLSIVPPGHGASFRAESRGGLATLLPLTDEASTWLKDKISDEATWSGKCLVVEMKYFAALADAIIDSGFFFEVSSEHAIEN